MLDRVNLGKRLKSAREAKGMKQKELAEQIHIAPQILSAYENGGKAPTLDNLVELADKLGESVDSLLGRDEKGQSHNEYTLGDVARTLILLRLNSIAEFSEQEIEKRVTPIDYRDDGERRETVPSIILTGDTDNLDGSEYQEKSLNSREKLKSFIVGYQKMHKLLQEKIITYDIYSRWEQSCLAELDGMPLTDPFEYLPFYT